MGARIASIRERLESHGLAPSRARGQNFLRSRHDARRIVTAVGVGSEDAALEIGPGLGDLTRELAACARRVLALELDHGLIRALAAAGLPPNIEVRHGDALQADLTALGRELGAPAVLVGNLPYRIAGRLIAQLLIESRPFESFRRLGFMVQTEVAERLLAEHGTPAYSSLSVWSGLFSTPRRVLELGPDAFVPRPKVHSTFVVFDPPALPRSSSAEQQAVLEQIVTLAFRFRRKTLRRALQGISADPARLQTALEEADIDGQRRGETLSPAELVKLAGAIHARALRG